MAQIDIHVDPSATGNGDGENWTDAYTSLQTALDDNAADLVTAGNNVVFHCLRGDGETNDFETSPTQIFGWITSADCDIVIEYDGSPHDANAFHLHCSNATLFYCLEDYVTLKGIYFYLAGANANADVLVINSLSVSNSILIDRCVIRGPDDDAYKVRCVQISDADTNLTLRNCLIYDAGQASFSAGLTSGAAPTVTMENCTVANCWRGIWLDNSGTDVTFTNVLVTGSDSNDFTFASVIECWGQINYCASEDDTADYVAGGTGNRINQTFTFADALYHLDEEDAGALGYGTNLSGTFTVDIDNETRSLWSIGADDGPAEAFEVSGTLAGQASLSATAKVTTSFNLAGTLAGSSGLTGTVAAVLAQEGIVAGTSTFSGSLTLTGPLYVSGTLAAQAVLTAFYNIRLPIAGALAAQSSWTGTIYFQGEFFLAGTLSGHAVLSAIMNFVDWFPWYTARPVMDHFSDGIDETATGVYRYASGRPLVVGRFTLALHLLRFTMPDVTSSERSSYFAFYEEKKTQPFFFRNPQDSQAYKVIFEQEPTCELDGRRDRWVMGFTLRQVAEVAT